MKYMQNRYYWTQDKKIDGMYRILCLGDSVLLGQGVTYFETLTYKMEEFLNRKVYNKEIEAVNFATSGFSIYDEWLEFLRSGNALYPDMVVITISNNDSALFRLPGNENHVDRWKEDSVDLQYFKLIIEKISNYSKQNNLPVIIAFFEFYDNDIKKKAWSTIKDLCKQHKVDCINISNGIEKDFLYDEKNLQISEVDGHPSVYATEKAANRLSEYLLNKGFFKTINGRFKADNLFYKSYMYNAEKSRINDIRPEMIFYRLIKLLTDKYNQKPFMSNNDFLSLTKEIKKIATDNIALLFIEAYKEVLIADLGKIFSALHKADILLTRLSKNIFVQEHNLADDNLKYFPYKKITKKTLNTKIIDALSSNLKGWLDDFAESEERFFKEQTISFNELDGFNADLNIRREKARRKIVAIWKNANTLITDFLELLSSLKVLITQNNPETSEEHLKTFIGLIDECISIFGDFEGLIDVLNLKKLTSLKNFKVVDKPICNCVVNFKSNAPKGQLHLQLDSLVPYYTPIAESHYLICDDEYHSCQFQFPLFTLGKIQLIIFGQGDLDFEDMKIYINENRQITLKKENFTKVADNIYDSGLIFNTI